MSDINRDSDTVELAEPPRFAFGERVIARSVVRNDGTFPCKDIGHVLVQRGDIGYVRNIGTFLQQYYIYGVEWIEHGYQVGMRAKELCTLDALPPEVLEQFADRLAQLKSLGIAPRHGDSENSIVEGSVDSNAAAAASDR